MFCQPGLRYSVDYKEKRTGGQEDSVLEIRGLRDRWEEGQVDERVGQVSTRHVFSLPRFAAA